MIKCILLNYNTKFPMIESQGRCDIQPSADPEELVFHVDPVIVEGISQARAQFDLNVSYLVSEQVSEWGSYLFSLSTGHA